MNTAMLGAVARVCPFLDPDAIKATIAEKLSAPTTRTSSRRTSARSTAGIASCECRPGPRNRATRAGRSSEPHRRSATSTRPIGGIILDAGNSVVKNLSTSRQGFLPELRRRIVRRTAGSATSSVPICASCGPTTPSERDRRAAARHRLPLLQRLPEVHRRVPDRLAHRAPRGARLGRGESRSALPMARACEGSTSDGRRTCRGRGLGTAPARRLSGSAPATRWPRCPRSRSTST